MAKNSEDVLASRVDLSGLQTSVEQINQELRKVIVGQQQMIEFLIAAIFADGHVLLEGVPGIAKTLTAKLLAKTVSVGFSRIQFTPDLMPSDVIGTSVFNLKKADFEFNKGPVFSNLILIDEINRAPAKTQAALFEVMEERQITFDGVTYVMDTPFIVFATQNPIEQEGTYRLPEAQIDRFLFKVEVEYPSLEEEATLLAEFHERKDHNEFRDVKPVLTAKQIADYREKVRSVIIDKNVIDYIVQIVHQTRNNQALFLGGSPRASLAIMSGAKAFAAMKGRDFVTPEDVKQVAYPALRHRLLLSPEKEMEGARPDDIIKQIVERIEVPR
ncbi:MoxR family ATPase [candidate division KSB1 bacterium]|nr:MoxR family ATPase [candidate division KSB1 bacterium]NIR70313.1 MoxR family ATPase [candidate division KSB1 bacterium]NIS27617.1 MoxR family ATPase [candidate division KSB1 bacterium]NIT74457.1 MoxR family ATPase [candidate division KSB1 bacterium]NIU28982.1 MoxR family ATPase [candidate division KSB1 bacterium]